MKSAEGVVTRNPSYQGAPEADVAHGSNWFHFRAKQLKKPSVQQLAHIDPAIGKQTTSVHENFFEAIVVFT